MLELRGWLQTIIFQEMALRKIAIRRLNGAKKLLTKGIRWG